MFGLPLAGRPLHLAGAERTVGMFVNTLPVRVDIKEEMTSRDLIVTMLNQASERELSSRRPYHSAPINQ